MGSVRIYGNKVNEAKAAAKALEQSIEKTYEQCVHLRDYVNSAKWSGKARDSFLTYLEIIEKYHEGMKSAVHKQTKALNNLERDFDDFLQDGSVKEVRNL
ncbi:WXG100 family type VII secretion target [Bacillus sp. BRMEA1]|uniref:WXG100 family type VII secretion target n=1 Tax=Neobacillus endophyticus TaxID=2738405 RepID=UPI0015636E47|nr:WXG100 family type VII secretion target [Neobacillus endophyticus]NRD77650.1 WXG100 family type VII secretion target [Neobacillus endophyticus]